MSVTIRYDRRTGDDNLIVQLHGDGYLDFDPRFAADKIPHLLDHVRGTVLAAGLDDTTRNRVWFAEEDGQTVGCIAMLVRGEAAQLRWFVLLPAARGKGVGRELMKRALDFARDAGAREVFLETVEGLEASMAMYKAAGFEVETIEGADQWHGVGHDVIMRQSVDRLKY